LSSVREDFYEFLTEDGEPRACASIPDRDCSNVPSNFTLNVLNGTFSKLAEKIINPGLTLPWIFNFLGAPSALVGALVPIKDAGSLLPQLFVSGKIRSKPKRKQYWVMAAIVQAIAMFLSGLAVFTLDGKIVPYLLAAALLIFSMASGVGSVAFKDVVAKTIPKGERGQMLSYRSTFGGILGLVAGGILVFVIKGNADKNVYAGMFVAASVLWFLAALLFHFIKEEKGATEGGRTPFNEFKRGADLLKSDLDFRNFIIVRALLMAIPLSQPFYILMSRNLSDGSWEQIGYIIIVGGIAQVVSSPFWGRLSDKSPTFLMRLVAFISIVASGFASYLYASDINPGFYWFLPVFFVHGIAYAGARLSRKTYLVDFAPDEERPTYVSVANTAIGLFTVVAAGFGFVAQFFGLIAQLGFFVLMLLAAALLSTKLKAV